MRVAVAVLLTVMAVAAARADTVEAPPPNLPAPALKLSASMGWRLDAVIRVDLIGGARVLVIEGDVINASDVERVSPTVRLGLRDSDGREFLHWTVRLDEARIRPHEWAAFEAHLENPPAESATVEIQTVENE